MKTGLFFVLGIIFFYSLASGSETKSKTRFIDSIYSSSDIKIVSNLAYGESQNQAGKMEKQMLDLYLPPLQGKDPLPWIIAIHGGGFTKGDKAQDNIVNWAKDRFAVRGYAVASVNYRLRTSAPQTQEEKLAAQLDSLSDVRAAIRFLRLHADEYHLDQHRVSSFGVSAGAILSLLISVTGNVDKPLVEYFKRVNENVANAGPSSAVCFSISASGSMGPEFRKAFLDSKDAGIVEFHGEKDTTVDYNSSKANVEAFDAVGVSAKIFSYPNRGHALPGDDVESRLIPVLYEHVIQGQCL